MIPLSETDAWEFGHTEKRAVSFVMMTDGVLDKCVDLAVMNNRIYFPFLKPALTLPMRNEEEMAAQKADWEEYLAGSDKYPVSFRKKVCDDITFTVVQNPEEVEKLPDIVFDFEKWEEDTLRRKKQLDDTLYTDYREYQKNRQQTSPHSEDTAELLTPALGDDSTENAAHDGDPVQPDGNNGTNETVADASAQPIQRKKPVICRNNRNQQKTIHITLTTPSISGQQIIETTADAIDSLIRMTLSTGRLARNKIADHMAAREKERNASTSSPPQTQRTASDYSDTKVRPPPGNQGKPDSDDNS
jgi:hypothetical protein